ncbi:hypothetical protein Tco_0875160 [Tanacetum coccineum]|uniref:Uncharacterized protein n=1 Tax=Tanacetum coccineum TaxID=301880 RepID=A0ABQ5BTJ6_9ASTR
MNCTQWKRFKYGLIEEYFVQALELDEGTRSVGGECVKEDKRPDSSWRGLVLDSGPKDKDDRTVLLRRSGGDSEPDMSFDKSASPEHLFSLARASCATIDDPRPVAGSFSMADVCRLSAHVIKLRDISKGMLVLSGLSHVWKSRVCDPVLWGADGNVMGIYDFLCLSKWNSAKVQEEPHHDIRPTLQRLSFYCTSPAATDAVISDPTMEDLAVGTPSVKILAKDKASKKRKASTSGATSSHVAKRNRSALAQSSGGTTRPSLFVDNSDDESDDDGDACVEILLVTPIRSATVIPSSGNQGMSFLALVAEGPCTRGISPRMLFMRTSSLFMLVLIMPLTLKVVLLGIASLLMRIPYTGRNGPVESLSDDQLTVKMSVLYYMMMSHVGELLARYRGLLQSHHEYVQSTNSRLKGFQEKLVGLSGLESQVSRLRRQVAGLNDNLSTSDVAFAKSKAKGTERKKRIKSLSKSIDQLNAEVARLSTALNQANVLEAEKDEVQGELLSLAANAGFERGLSMHRTKDEFAYVLKKMAHFVPGTQGRLAEMSPLVAQTDYAFLNKISKLAAEPLSIILQLETEKLVRPANIPASRDARVSPPIVKESTVTSASKSLELSDNVGTSYVLDDVAEVTVVGSGRVSSSLTDVVVALSAGEKGDGFLLSSTTDEEATANPSGV